MTDRNEGPANEDEPRLMWLVAGALLGLLLAAFGLLERSGELPGLEGNDVARVNEAVIDLARFERAVTASAASAGREITAAERSRILDQLIDEELLVQRGTEMDIVATEPAVRSAIVQSLIASVTAEADASNPDDETLERYLSDHAEDYTYATALGVDAWVTDDEREAQRFVASLRSGGEANAEGVRPVPGLPADPLPLERLRMFVGPAIAAAAATMPDGSSAVYARQGRWYVVRVNSHEEEVQAELDAVRSQVLIDYRRNLAGQLLEDYLRSLRDRANLIVAMPE